MKFLSLVGNSFGCSASGERLVSAARDGDIQEAKALLEYNPRLARYSTFGVRNSPLHYSAAHGHHEIVYLLLESGVDINLRNYRGQTALMQACQHGHWEVVQTLIIFNANIHKADYLNGGTALHLAALNGHTRCIRLILADYIPSIPNFWNVLQTGDHKSLSEFDQSGLCEVISRTADGGITALHMAALNGHVESVQLLLDLGASVSEVTVEDGTTIDLIGSGSTPLHYAACGGNAQCCQLLIAKGASLAAENANGWTPLMVARSWHRNWLEDILKTPPEDPLQVLPSPYLSLPLMSIVRIARECGWRTTEIAPTCLDPCAVCLERKCMVAVEGCDHEFCTQCALYLCSANPTSTTTHGPPGSIACPLCRHGIVSFVKLPDARPIHKEIPRTTNLSLTFCTCSSEVLEDSTDMTTPFCKPTSRGSKSSPSKSFRSMSCQRLSSFRMNPNLCLGADVSPSLVPCTVSRNLRNHGTRCSGSGFRRSSSQTERRKSWFCSFNQSVSTGSGC
ncbi:probable E3 ubiquitin-protein ligase XBOS32 isoform X2 [Abrus precatorius]|uniref:RING-type E3 ubiquitin transferase n=1 Tax=Abrus precatorius TaxID=3816 RepID=A0A8B8JGL5_ABRPR|nr:probable E3 ubiquitin-protein ligase XBOS32 isoform X2 [Abrus precatorius]